MPERTPDHIEQIGEVDLFRLDRHGARLNLRQVEDVADQVQQIGAGAVNGAGEFHLLAAQVAFRILRQLLAQDQNAVERRAQLVRHIRQKL